MMCACRISKHTSTQTTPFSLVYMAEAMVHIEVVVLLACLALVSKMTDLHNHFCDIEALKERRHSAENKCYPTRGKSVRHTTKEEIEPFLLVT